MHDQNFKNLILDYPRQALAFFAAGEFGEVDQTAQVTPVRQEQLKGRLGDRFRELDTPLLVEWPDGRREALLFVIEEESDPRRFSIHRLAHYCLDLAELFDTTRVVPVVIFLRGEGQPSELALAGDRHEYLRFRYLQCPLARLPFESWCDSDNLVARLNLPNMSYTPKQKLEVYASATRGLAQLEEDPERQLKYADFIDLYAALDEDERRRYQALYPKEHSIMLSFSERFIQQGRHQGLQQGRQQGHQQGHQQGVQEGGAQLLLHLLRLKFGELPTGIREKVETADSETLLQWSDRILSANSLTEVFEDQR